VHHPARSRSSARLPIGIALGLLGAGAKLSGDPVGGWRMGTSTPASCGAIPSSLVIPGLRHRLAVRGPTPSPRGSAIKGHIDVSPFVAGIVALGFMFGAYATRGFSAAPSWPSPRARSRRRAPSAWVSWLTFRRVTLPAGVAPGPAGTGNRYLVLMKDSALVSLIGLNDIMRVSGIAAQATKNTVLFYFVAALIYLALTVLSMRVQAPLEAWAKQGLLRAVR